MLFSPLYSFPISKRENKSFANTYFKSILKASQ